MLNGAEEYIILKLQLVGNRNVTLGDENTVVLAVYQGKVLWHGQERDVLVLQVDGGPLVGLSLLYGNRVPLEIIEDGDVTINPLPCVFALNFFLVPLR